MNDVTEKTVAVKVETPKVETPKAPETPGAELIEVSPKVFELCEKVREKVDVKPLEFYRRIIRRGLLGEFGSPDGTYGLIGQANKVFLKIRTPEAGNLRDKIVNELIALKAEAEAL